MKIKKYLIFLVSLLVVAAIAFGVGCGTYTPPIYTDPDNQGNSSNGKDPNKPDDEEIIQGGLKEGFTFTVTLTTRDSYGHLERYTPPADAKIEAQWRGEDGIYSEPFKTNGTATIILDGDYTVSLSNMPKDANGNDIYTYDPNGLKVTNAKRSIQIELLEIKITSQKTGRGLYTGGKGNAKAISLSESGAYKVTLNNPYTFNQPWLDGDGLVPPNDIVYFEYRPPTSGFFLVESIVDVTDNTVNPSMWMCEVCTIGYKGNYVWWEFIDGGGSEGTYTKNFRHIIALDPTFEGNVMTFGVCANTTKQGKDAWPVSFYFRVLYIGEYNDKEVITANGPFYTGDAPSGTWKWSYEDNPVRENGHYVLDGSGDEVDAQGNPVYPMRYKLNWEDVNGNGEFDEWVDLNNNGECDPEEIGVEGDGFYHMYDKVKYADNNGWGPLLWANIWGNDEVFGSNHLTGPTYARTNAPMKERDYQVQFWNIYLAYAQPAPGGDTVTLHPVNKEIMEALQFLVVANKFFYDGEGQAETGKTSTGTGKIFDAYNDYMFLIVCGYFA